VAFNTKYKYYIIIYTQSKRMNQDNNVKHENDDEDTLCNFCGNIMEACMCVCPYCGIRDKCECCILDATTGG
jgi:hypothetical protein